MLEMRYCGNPNRLSETCNFQFLQKGGARAVLAALPPEALSKRKDLR